MLLTRSSGRHRGGSNRVNYPAHRHSSIVVATIMIISGAATTRLNPGHARAIAAGYTYMRTVVVGRRPLAVAVAGRTGQVFVISDGAGDGNHTMRGSVSVLGTATDDVLDTEALGVSPVAIVVDQSTGRAFVSNAGDKSVSVLEAASGQRRSSHQARVSSRIVTLGLPSSVVIPVGSVAADERDRHVFVANFNDNSVSMLDSTTGRLLRTVPVGSNPQSIAVDDQAERVFVANSNYGHPGTVTMLDARSGNVVSTILVGVLPRIVATDSRSGRVVVMGKPYTTVLTLDARSGSIVRTSDLPTAPPPVALAIVQKTKRAFIVCSGGTIDIIDMSDGKLVSTTRVLPFPQAVAVDEHSGHLLVADARGSVSVLDGGTGRLLSTVPVGHNPVALAVDPSTGHLFVANYDAGTVTMLGRR